jgi:hypothetical protein
MPHSSAQLFQRNEPLSFSASDRHRATAFVGKKMLHRREQIRTQSPLLFADSAEIAPFQ